jgi:glutamate---cysteine ligase / carboxylate-amine ligase
MSREHYTLGIEEEYFLVDLSSRALVRDPPATVLEECKEALGTQFSAEYQRSQVEIATKICRTMAEARSDLLHLRNTVAAIANRHGLAPMAASTHPFTPWRTQLHADKHRYREIANELKTLGRRMVIGGMHVHVAIENNEERITTMNDVRPYLALLLALSTSSPFWQGENTGLKSYRTAINDATPRNGIPERFKTWRDYCEALECLVRSGVIEDATKIWWDLRPSARFPTLELRITDVCPLIDDAVCIAALFRCLCRCVHRQRSTASGIPNYPLLLLNENRWRAQRYGLEGGFVDPQRCEVVESGRWVSDVLGMVAEDAEFFASQPEMHHTRTLLVRGTSADRQLALYWQELDRGERPGDALRAVVDAFIAETLSGSTEHLGRFTS